MTKLFMVFMLKVPNVVWLRRFHIHIHTHRHTYPMLTKVMRPYWMRHKISDDLTTIWFNIVNTCILCHDFKWHIKIELKPKSLANIYSLKNVIVSFWNKVDVTATWSKLCWQQTMNLNLIYSIVICLNCTQPTKFLNHFERSSICLILFFLQREDPFTVIK